MIWYDWLILILPVTRHSSLASWAQRAREALAVPRELVRSPGNFSTDPAVFYRWHDEMADLIEEAGGAWGHAPSRATSAAP